MQRITIEHPDPWRGTKLSVTLDFSLTAAGDVDFVMFVRGHVDTGNWENHFRSPETMREARGSGRQWYELLMDEFDAEITGLRVEDAAARAARRFAGRLVNEFSWPGSVA